MIDDTLINNKLINNKLINNKLIIDSSNQKTILSNEETTILCKDKLIELLNKYENNDYIKNKLVYHILNQLGDMLEQADSNHIRREERKQKLESDQIEFTTRFLNKNNYFYISNTDIFFNYDGNHYRTYKEDDILHEILTSITQEETLMPWKHKIKLNVIKQIRERSLFTSIPESCTVQYVLNNIFPSLFSTKAEAKYFLTILGDNILRKNENIIYLINPNVKNIINALTSAVYNYFGNSNILNSFKYKYHEQHNYSDCRLIYFDRIYKANFLLNEFNINILDLLCVSVYYSSRYNCADDYLISTETESLINYSFYLKNNTPELIVNEFIDKSLQICTPLQNSISSQGMRINSKKMMYLWKTFLRDNKLPHIIFLGTLKNMLKEKLTYYESCDNFMNVTSIHLPLISNFINFWDGNMRDNEEDTELEIEEIIILFRHWYLTTQLKQSISISDTLVLELIRHFFSDTIIDGDKYILHMSCILWDKNKIIKNFLENLRSFYLNKKEKYGISLNSIYINYCKYSKKDLCTASKIYFEKTTREFIGNNMRDDNIIDPSWWQEVNLS